MRGDPHREAGQVAVWVLGMTLVVVAVAGIAVDGTRAFVLRRTLQGAADSAALAGANALDTESYYASGGDVVALDPRGARSQTASWLARRSLRADRIDADPARVRLVVRGVVPTTFLRLVGIDRIPVAVESVAVPAAGSP